MNIQKHTRQQINQTLGFDIFNKKTGFEGYKTQELENYISLNISDIERLSNCLEEWDNRFNDIDMRSIMTLLRVVSQRLDKKMSTPWKV